MSIPTFEVPQFHNQDIHKAMLGLQKKISDINHVLDFISEDINRLEKFLQLNGVKISAKIEFKSFELSVEYLSWAFDEKSGKYRLFHEVLRFDASDEDAKVIEQTTKPLIECRMDIRIDSIKVLPLLIEYLGRDFENLKKEYNINS